MTPTGIRQHYFIGNEYRERYVYEAELMAELYNIQLNDLQTAFQGSSITSLEAQMMGLYPQSNLNLLNSWQ